MSDSALDNVLQFRRMATPVIIRILFFFAVLAAVFGGIAMMMDGQPLYGLLAAVLGALGARITAELLIVIFQINETLTDISDGLLENNRLLEDLNSVRPNAGADGNVAGGEV